MTSIESFLHHLGLQDIERDIYLTLLQKGPSSVTDLAQKIGINRVTLHFHLKEMSSRGIVAHIKEGRTRQVRAESPEIFRQMLQEKKRKIQVLEQEYKLIKEEFKKQTPKIPQSNLEVKLYKGNKSVRLVYEHVLKAKELRAYVSDDFDYYFPDYEEIFIKTHKRRKNMKFWEILDESEVNEPYIRQMDPKRYWCKVLPGKLDIIDYLIFDGKVVYVDAESKDRDSVMAYVIENVNIYKNAKRIFDYVWQVLPEESC